MDNSRLVTALLREKGLCPPGEDTPSAGLRLEPSEERLMLSGSAWDLIDLADLLVSLALDPTPGSHWHIDSLNLMEEGSPVAEMILLKNDPPSSEERSLS